MDVYFADINWNSVLAELDNHNIKYAEISKFPEVKRDLALLLDKNVAFAEISYEEQKAKIVVIKNNLK